MGKSYRFDYTNHNYILCREYAAFCMRKLLTFKSFFTEDDFLNLQRSFMEKYYLEFDDTEENKLIYTPIFNEYVSCLM